MRLPTDRIFRGAMRAGFTLIEVMVVMAIVAILAAVAYPSYQEFVRKSKRAEGQATLMQLMQQQERYFSQNNTYIAFSQASTDENERRFKWYSGNSAATSAYEIKGAACENETLTTCVELTAVTGMHAQNVDAHFDDPRCGTLHFDSKGKKSAGANDCWR